MYETTRFSLKKALMQSLVVNVNTVTITDSVKIISTHHLTVLKKRVRT